MTRVDPYPSRAARVQNVVPRKEPVVYASPEEREKGPLPRPAFDAYERRGFLWLEQLLEPDELQVLIDAGENLRSECRDDRSPHVIREPETDAVRSIFAVHERHGAFEMLVHHPRLVTLAERILGSAVYIHQSRINYKPAFRGEPFPWHSDFETWHTEDGMPRMRAFSVSLNLTENRADNGPLMVIPETHRLHIPCVGATPDANWEQSLRRQEVGTPPEAVLEKMATTYGIESPTGPPGSATLFDCNLLHGSNGNITPFPRSNVFLVFNSVENALEEPFSGQRPRPRYIASRDAVPLR